MTITTNGSPDPDGMLREIRHILKAMEETPREGWEWCSLAYRLTLRVAQLDEHLNRGNAAPAAWSAGWDRKHQPAATLTDVLARRLRTLDDRRPYWLSGAGADQLADGAPVEMPAFPVAKCGSAELRLPHPPHVWREYNIATEKKERRACPGFDLRIPS